MKKIYFIIAALFTQFSQAQVISNTTVSEILASDSFEDDAPWKNFDTPDMTLGLNNELGGTQNFTWSDWGGAAVNGDQSATGGSKCLQVHWGGYTTLRGFEIDPEDTYQLEALIHPAGGDDGTWGNWAAVHLFVFDNSEIWQENGVRIRMTNGTSGVNPNHLTLDVWDGEDGTPRVIELLDFNDNPSKYYINGVSASYWVPLKVIFTGEGTTEKPILMDFYLNDQYVASTTLDNIVWRGDNMIGLGRNGDSSDHAKFDNIKLSKLGSGNSLNSYRKNENYYFDCSNNAVICKGDVVEANYELIDLAGRVINHGSLKSSETVIPVEGLNGGTYFIRIVDENTNKPCVLPVIIK